jgi:hypothetical protein
MWSEVKNRTGVWRRFEDSKSTEVFSELAELNLTVIVGRLVWSPASRRPDSRREVVPDIHA